MAWLAAIGCDYRIICAIVTRTGKAPLVSVVENGQSLEQQELVAGASTGEVEAPALRLRQQYEPRIAGVAKRTWRFGRGACLTTSWSPRVPSPEDPPAA